ncbi:Diguanylate cyclase, GGDEF domain [Vibrio hangzhouensis]|uniref:Diguanylate cyclase, GGDEF domain n=2 Tax=Vibrio hangzhouensis TaxID=462991 RepID=A0A1H5X1Y6_9VIBR|nr:Diguanylate cyclase, GGDEF domain [Vibrio hangzhouensis]
MGDTLTLKDDKLRMRALVVGKVPRSMEHQDVQVVDEYLDDEILREWGRVCVINVTPERQDETLLQIHSSPAGWSWRVLTLHHSELAPFLSDAVFNGNDVITEELKPFPKLKRLSDVPKDKLLAYLWINETRRIRPMKVLSNSEIYRYPLLDVYHNQQQTPFRYLHRLIDSGLIEAERCEDRVRYCQSCGSGHLNFVDTCPSCQSIDIKTFDALHCFTCGHVDDADKFVSRRAMTCPNCHTSLKHIGVDYDRPLELYSCNHCSQEFAEANVVASCLSCGHQNATSDLTARSYYTYRAGENIQRHLLDEQVERNTNLVLAGTVSTAVFDAALGWKNQLSLRHKHQDLLLGIKIHQISQFIAEQGDVAYIEFISAFAEQLEQLFRTTDISCQYADDTLFILLPHCDISFMSSIEKRIEAFSDKVESDILSLTVMSWALPDNRLSDANKWLLERSSELND